MTARYMTGHGGLITLALVEADDATAPALEASLAALLRAAEGDEDAVSIGAAAADRVCYNRRFGGCSRTQKARPPRVAPTSSRSRPRIPSTIPA